MQENYKEMGSQIQAELQKVVSSGGWQKATTEGNCVGYKKDNGTGGVVTKGELVIKMPIEKISAFLSNDDNFKKMNESCLLNNVLEKGEGYKIKHIQVKTPFPMDNRQMVACFIHRKNGNTQIFAGRSCNYKIPVDEKFVRAQMNITGWILERIDANTTRVINVSDFDPSGNVPDMMKNKMAEKKSVAPANLEKLLKNA